MGVKKVGTLIKEARTNAGYTQEQLAKLIPGLTASDISKAERGEKALSQEQLRSIAKLTGVTQKSLLEAAGTGTSSSKKTSTSKSSAATGTSMKVSTTERKLVELYRAADSESKKKVMLILKGDYNEGGEFISSLLGGALDSILKK